LPLFRRERVPTGGVDRTDPGDTPEAMRAALEPLRRQVNRSAGRLPVEATVAARRLLDTVREIVDEDHLDVAAVVSVRSTIEDYLPTSLSSYLSLDEAVLDRPRADGRTPRASLLEQLDDLETSAEAVLAAVRERDADALMTQGAFLRTKFSRSDLDL